MHGAGQVFAVRTNPTQSLPASDASVAPPGTATNHGVQDLANSMDFY